MKILDVRANNYKKAFFVRTRSEKYLYPYGRLMLHPGPDNRIIKVSVDADIGREGFKCVLESGEEETVHIEQVLEYNRDPGYLKDVLLYRLTIEAVKRIRSSPVSKREIIRRLGTSATQFYRLLDPKNNTKSVDQMIRLLSVLDCDVELKISTKST